LFDALCESRLIEREKGFEGCDWSRCGRTDRGVSAAGQVVALWVRSAIKPPLAADKDAVPTEGGSVAIDGEGTEGASPSKPGSTPVQQELRYVLILNRILPPSIRVLAWSPSRTTSRPASIVDTDTTNISSTPFLFQVRLLTLIVCEMQASRLVGEHDFRNFCKLDGSKQISKIR
jgi:tRNA pseudouridine38/39 synthase